MPLEVRDSTASQRWRNPPGYGTLIDFVLVGAGHEVSALPAWTSWGCHVSRGGVVAKNTAFLAVGQVITWSLSALFLLKVPRAVGPSEWGEYSLAIAMTGVATAVAGLGITTLLIKDIARNLDRAGEYVGTGILTRLLLAVPFLLVVGGTVLVAGYPAHTRLIITIVTVTMLIRFGAAPITSGLQAFQKMHINAVGDVITNGFISFAGVALVVFFKGGMISIAMVSLAASLAVMSVEGWVLSRTTSIRARFDRKLIRHMIIGSLPYWVSGLVLTFYLWVDSVLLSFFTKSSVVGWYGAATNLFGALLFVPTILSTALLPALAHAHLHDRPGMRALMRRSFTLITGLSLPLAVGTALLAPAIINLIYGAEYAPSGQILVVLAVTLVPTYINVLAGTFLISADRQIVWTRVMAGACVLNPLVNLVTIMYFQRHYGNGGLGAAVALLVTELLMACAGLWLIPRALLDRAALMSLTRSAAATVVMGAVVWLLRGQFVVIPIAIGALVYGGAALALRVFPREDWELVTPILAKITQRVRFRGRPPADTEPPASDETTAVSVHSLSVQDARP
jgi:O-antigen/teichoic acid export membrane protein